MRFTDSSKLGSSRRSRFRRISSPHFLYLRFAVAYVTPTACAAWPRSHCVFSEEFFEQVEFFGAEAGHDADFSPQRQCSANLMRHDCASRIVALSPTPTARVTTPIVRHLSHTTLLRSATRRSRSAVEL